MRGRFEPVAWDEAIADIAARFQAIAGGDGDGAGKIVHAHYTGTCSLIANNFPMRFLGRLGAREVEPDTVCNMAGHVALDYAIGTSVIGFDPRTAKDAHCISSGWRTPPPPPRTSTSTGSRRRRGR